jgi:transcriptional regulator with XRE-family HTH domain
MDIVLLMDVASSLSEARGRADLTQAALARRAGTTQATISAYESGRKQPSLETFERLLAACGARLAVVPGAPAVKRPSAAERARAARALADVLALAEALPTRHDPALRFPPLRRAA